MSACRSGWAAVFTISAGLEISVASRFPYETRLVRFVGLMLRAYQKDDWSDWYGRSARELVEQWCGPRVADSIFEPLCRLKFELPADQVSAAWMGARLHAREGSGKLGYIPGANWTTVLCDGLVRLAQDAGVDLRTGVTVAGLGTRGRQVCSVFLDNGEAIDADVVVSAMPTGVLGRLLPDDPLLPKTAYTALLSLVCGTRQEVPDDFYWLSLLSPELTSSGMFVLSALNPTIGPPGEHCLNFITHLSGSNRPLFSISEPDLLARYKRDYQAVFGIDLVLDWWHLSRIPTYSPVFFRDYKNPEIRCESWDNLYLTGNYRTYPSVASTGTALRSGLETATSVLSDHPSSSRPVPVRSGGRARRRAVANVGQAS